MGIFTVAISAIVDAIFTNAKGYNAGLRTDMKAFQEASIVTLVNQAEPYEELDQKVKDTLAATQWGNAVGNARTDIDDCCEQVINLAKNFYTLGGNPGGYKKCVLWVTQAGVGVAPVINKVIFNGIGLIDLVTQDAVGVSTFRFPANSFPDPDKVVVTQLGDPITGSKSLSLFGFGASDRTVTLQTSPYFQDGNAAGSNVLVGALADDMLGQGGIPTRIQIEYYP